MKIELVTDTTDELLEGITRLIPQLKISASSPSREEVIRLINSDAISMIIARADNNDMIGMLTLIVYPVPTGTRARIEDVVVDESHRGQGVAVAMVKRALGIARDKGAEGVALTSNPRRAAANRLYQKMGFIKWETNVYYLKFEHPAEF